MTENNHIPVFYEGQDDLIEISSIITKEMM